GDARARTIYETIGVYLGYQIAHFADFYPLKNLLILGRVTSGQGGDVIVAGAKALLETEFPELAGKIQLRVPDEKMKRHGQAIAAASLPEIARAASNDCRLYEAEKITDSPRMKTGLKTLEATI